MNCFFQDFAGSKLFIFLVGMSRWSNSWYNWSHLVGGHYSLFLLEWVYGRRKKRWVTISVEWPKAVFFAYTHTHPETEQIAPENGWLGFHPFVLGFGLFSGASRQLQGSYLFVQDAIQFTLEIQVSLLTQEFEQGREIPETEAVMYAYHDMLID